MKDVLYFRETVKYNLKLLWGMLLLTIVGTVTAAGLSFYAGSMSWFTPLLVTLMIAALSVFFAVTELRLELRQDSFIFQYYPWGSYEYFREDIVSIILEEYDANKYAEFDLKRDHMRIMGGQYCLHITLKNGRNIYLSTNKARDIREQLSLWLKDGEHAHEEGLELDTLTKDEVGLEIAIKHTLTVNTHVNDELL